MYEQLGLGELKSISIILRLGNGSVIVPKGVVEDFFGSSVKYAILTLAQYLDPLIQSIMA